MDARFVLQALVNVCFAVRPFKTWLALARIVTDTVNTVTVLAWTAVALVDIDFTVLTHRTGNTDALISARILERERLRENCRQILRIVVQIVQRDVRSLQTLSGVLARIGFALIDILFAVFPCVTWITFALVVVDFVDALGSV